MRIAIFGKNIPEKSLPYIQELISALESIHAKIYLFHEFSERNQGKVHYNSTPHLFSRQQEIKNEVDFLLSIGGDGTILDAAGIVGDSGIPIAGINTGRLGFLSGISREMILPALNALQEHDYQLEKRSLLLLEEPGELFAPANFALNEITVHKPNVMSMLTVRTWVNGQFVNAYWADGLIIATPTGSTAYSLSCMGPILTPDTESFLITPVASHNLTVRPMVVRDDCKIRLTVEAKNEEYLIGLDARIRPVRCSTELSICKAPFQINLLKLKDKTFFQTIREKLNWGLDNRN